MVRDLGQMRKTRVPEDQLEQTKALVFRKIPLSESSIDRIAGGFLDRATRNLPLDEPERAAKKYKKLTGADIQRAFSKWIRPSNMVQIIRGPAPQ